MAYPTPTVNDTSGFYNLFSYVNDTSGGLLFLTIISVIWVVLFISSLNRRISLAFTFASFICTVLGVILTVLNLLAPRFMYLMILLTAVGVVWTKLGSEV